MFTVDSAGSANNWGHLPPSRPPTALTPATAPPAGEEAETKDPASPPPPYTAAVYDPNATDELQEWEERNI